MAGQDPTAVVEALIAAENALDVDAAMATFADGAVVTLPTGVLATADEIRGWQTGLAAGHFHADIGPIQVEGDHARFSGTVGFDPFRGMGIDAMGSEWDLTVAAGRITTFTYTFTPEGAARLQAALGGGAPAERS
jgi:hypothetical protein